MQHTQFEEWRPVVGWEGIYEVSNHGRVKSLERRAKIGNGKTRRVSERIMKLTSGPAGRLMVGLKEVGRNETKQVHRLVLTAFVGPCPEGMEACHNNGNHLDNRLDNLRWDTRESNIADMIKHKAHPSMRQTHCFRGHILSRPNLAPSSLRKGRRQCLACARAQSHISYHAHLKEKFQEVSDSYYRAIIKR